MATVTCLEIDTFTDYWLIRDCGGSYTVVKCNSKTEPLAVNLSAAKVLTG